MELPAQPSDWKKFEQNKRSIALNILFVPNGTKDIKLAYKSKYNGKHEKKVILLMIGDGKKWHYLGVKKYSNGQKSLVVPAAYYSDIECLIKQIDTCHNNPEQTPTTRVSKHEPCGFSIVAKSSITDIREKNTCYRGEDCMEKYCKKLREWVMKIVNYEMKEMIPLTEDENDYHKKQNSFICNKRFCYDN